MQLECISLKRTKNFQPNLVRYPLLGFFKSRLMRLFKREKEFLGTNSKQTF